MAMEGTQIRLWKRVTKSGKVYLTGSMSKVTRLVVVMNDRKKDGDTQSPDYFAYIVPNRGTGHVNTQVDDL